jgi:hypothetical protein
MFLPERIQFIFVKSYQELSGFAPQNISDE